MIDDFSSFDSLNNKLLANPFYCFLKGFVLWTILVRIFRVALLFVCQSSYRLSPCPCSLGATIVSYQSRFRLSRTFWESFWKKFVSPFLQVVLNQESHYILSFGESFFVRFSGEGGIWTLAPLLTTCTLSRGVPSASLGTSPNTARFTSRYSVPLLPSALNIILKVPAFVNENFIIY